VRLLERAEAVLDGTMRLPSQRGTRVAAWFGRAALEAHIDTVLASHGITAERVTMRTKLACLSILDPDHANTTSVTWWGLSRCCHHHAYELSPTVDEVRHSLNAVRCLLSLPIPYS
jgi:hypothetical protein